MAWGDDLMAAGEARRLHEMSGGRVAIVSQSGGRPQVSALWRGLDYIAKPGECADVEFVDGPRSRQYRQSVDHEGSRWRAYRPIPAELRFTLAEQEFASRFKHEFVVIEPHIKAHRDGAANRDWGWQNYADLVARSPDVRWLQMVPPGLAPLPGVEVVTTDTFRLTCAVLARARAFVGPEGGLHHACAALNVPAVVIFGGYISPAATGYDDHISLFTGRGLGCGRRSACACNCMSEISVDRVAEALKNLLGLDRR